MSTSFKGLTITIGADTKQFNKDMRRVDRSIRGTNRQVNELQRGLELEFDAGRFAEAQRLAQQAIEQTESKAEALRQQMKFLEESGANTQTDQFRRLQTELVKTENQAVLLKNRLDEIRRLKIEELAKQFEKVGGGITKAGRALMPFSAAAGGALAGLAAMGKSAASTGGELDDLAMQMDMTAESYQKLSYVAAQTGADIGRVERAFTLMRDTMGKALLGETNKSTEAMMRLGFTMDQIRSTSPEELFYEVVGSLASMEDQTLQAAYATEIFNQRVAHDILPLLRSGANAVEELSAEFESLGYLTNEQVTRLATFDDSLLRITTAFGAMKDQIGAALLPTMEAFAAYMETKVIPSVRKLTEWFTNLTDSQQRLLLGALAFTAVLAPALILIGKLTTGIGGVVRAVGGLNNALSFLAAHPVIAIIGIIAALIGVLYASNEQFRGSINTLVGALGEALAPILSTITELLQTLLEIVAPLIGAIGDVLTPIIQGLANALIPIISLITTLVGPLMSRLKTAMNTIKILMGPVIGILNALSWVLDKIYGLWDKAFGKVIEHVLNPFLKFLEGFINRGIDLINGLIDSINSLGGWLGISLDKLNHVKMQIDTGDTKVTTSKTETDQIPSVSDALNTSPTTNASYAPVTNNDYSNKNITIEVVVQNYAEEVDVDDMVRQINIKLAEQM